MKQILLFLCVNFFALESFAQISGVVTEKESGERLIGATVYLMELEKGTVTDTKGVFSFTGLPNNKLTIQVSYLGYQTEYIKWLPESKVSNLKIELKHVTIRQEEVVVSAGFSDTQHKNAISVDFLDNKQINATTAISSNQLLSKFPGIDVASGSPAESQPVIRGLSGTNILMLNNGIRLENYQFSRHHPFIVDEYGTERIEVIKGPASLLYGSDAVGGVINFIKELPAPTDEMEADFRTRYFSNTSGFNTTLGVKQSSDHFQWGVRGVSKSHGDYHDGNNNTIPNSRYTSNALKTFVGYNFKNGSTKFYYDYTKDNIGLTIAGVDTLKLGDTNTPDVFYQDLANHFLSSKTTLFIGNLKLNANLGYQINKRKEIEMVTRDDNGIAINSELNTFNYELKAQSDLSEKLKSIFGLQGMYRKNTNHEAEGKIIPDANLFDLSGFGFFQYTANHNFVMQAGLRYDYRSLDVPLQERGSHDHDHGSAESVHEDEEHELIELNRNFSNISGSLGATYHLSESTLLRANFASAFRAPNLAELTQAGMHAGRHEEGNPDLKAQRSYEADLGIHSHYELISIDVSTYHNYIDNYIYLAPTEEVEHGNPVYLYGQTKASLSGAEAGIHYHPNTAKWLHIKGTGSYIYARRNDNTPLPFIPPFKGNIEFKFEKDDWGILHRSFFQFDIDLVADQNNPSEFESSTPGYYLLNAMVGTALKAGNIKLDLSISANNILNRQYVDHLNLLKDLGYYNMGRNLSIGVSARF
nr:TonB-dependent receptor [uncultured Carboxylicivirga sp.]